jgi:hypothetical protein
LPFSDAVASLPWCDIVRIRQPQFALGQDGNRQRGKTQAGQNSDQTGFHETMLAAP